LVGIRVEHIVRVEAGIEIELPTSKTDTDGKGRIVFIPFAHSERCPVRAVDKWIIMARIESGTVFRQVTRHDYVTGTGLTPHAVALILKSAVSRAGGDPTDVSGHSLRSGFCTQAAMSDIPNWMVRQITGHTSDAMLNVYCRPVKRRKIPSLL
jgi:integrase